MIFSDDILRFDEKAIMSLRALYRQYGYCEYRMSRFEEYSVYADNKSFLVSDNIITFTDAGGRLMALRPDVTLSIVKSVKDDGTLKKLYYNENIYRPEGAGREFKELMQTGLECLGDIDVSLTGEVVALAALSLNSLGNPNCLGLSHMGFISGFLDSAGLSDLQKTDVLRLISDKNAPELKKYCSDNGLDDNFSEKAASLAALYGPFGETLGKLRAISSCADTDAAIYELEDIYEVLLRHDAAQNIKLDFSIVNDLNYYSGIIFQGFIEGLPAKVLSGGRYDKLMRKFGKNSGAVGFAVYLDRLERLAPQSGVAAENRPGNMLNIALPKGRLGESAYAVFESSGFGCPSIREDSRKLVFENAGAGVRYFWVKPSDVAIYVERGAADIGVAGKDILLEYSPDVYELLDLGIGKCRMCAASEKGFTADSHDRTLRVATKFTHIAREYYDKLGQEIDIIRLNGSIELAPLLGLSDVIVDIVETGNTLYENGLVPTETITDISARLISNKASFRFNHGLISGLCSKVASYLEGSL